MSEHPFQIRDLISTPAREEMFKMVSSLKDGFTFLDVYTALEKEKANVSITSVQNFLKALSYRGYLKEYNIKDTKTRGRSTIHFKKLVKF